MTGERGQPSAIPLLVAHSETFNLALICISMKQSGIEHCFHMLPFILNLFENSLSISLAHFLIGRFEFLLFIFIFCILCIFQIVIFYQMYNQEIFFFPCADFFYLTNCFLQNIELNFIRSTWQLLTLFLSDWSHAQSCLNLQVFS